MCKICEEEAKRLRENPQGYMAGLFRRAGQLIAANDNEAAKKREANNANSSK